MTARDAQLAVRVDGAAPLTTLAGQPLFASEMSLATTDQRVALRSDYALSAGELLSPADAARWRPGTVPQTLGSQRIGQQADLRLHTVAGAPVMLNLRHEQEQLWLQDTAIAQQREGVGLRWAPEVAAVDVQWQGREAPVDTRNALACSLRSTVNVPVAPLDPRLAVQVGGRACEVVPLDVTAPAGQAQTWSAGLGWGDSDQRRAALRLLMVNAENNAASAAVSRASAHELGVEHEERMGPWSARAGVAWRQRDAVAHDDEAGRWAGDARLSRDLGTMSVAAQWQSGDRYWFLPGASTPSDDLALSVDFSRWAAQRWPGYAPTLSLAYRWQRTDAGPTTDAYEDGSLEWRLSLPWR
jgi:hypothetical protein